MFLKIPHAFMFTKRNGICCCQYKYLDSCQQWLPAFPVDSEGPPDRTFASYPIDIEYFQSIGGPASYATLVDKGSLAYPGKEAQ